MKKIMLAMGLLVYGLNAAEGNSSTTLTKAQDFVLRNQRELTIGTAVTLGAAAVARLAWVNLRNAQYRSELAGLEQQLEHGKRLCSAGQHAYQSYNQELDARAT